MDTVCSAKVATQTLTVSFSGTGGGNVYASPVGATWSSDLSSDSVDLPQGTTVTLSALPYSNSTFDGWPGVCNKDGGNCVMTMDAPKSINATFNAAPKVRGAVKQFDTLQAAYNDPTTDNGSIIKLIEGALTGSFTAGRNIGVILEGGYDASYSAIGVTTIIQPPVLIRSGIVRIQGLISIK